MDKTDLERRNAYVLTINLNSERAQFTKNVLETIGFDVTLVPCIPNANKVLSNKISMQHIYKMIIEKGDEYSYVFEDDINVLEKIDLREIIEYEKISPEFFYLGVCRPVSFIDTNIEILQNIEINGHKIHRLNYHHHGGLHAIGLSKKGVLDLLKFSENSNEIYMDVILSKFTEKYPANVVRYDLESYIKGHRGIIFQDRKKFPTTI